MTDSVRKTLIILCVLLALVLVLFARERKKRRMETAVHSLEVWSPTEDPNAPMLLGFGAHGCLPSNQMLPILSDLRAAYPQKLRVLFINMDKPENQAAVAMHGIKIRPTQIFKDPNGTELFRHEGYLSKETILSKWKTLGYPLIPAP